MKCIMCSHSMRDAHYIAMVDGELEAMCDSCFHKALPFLKEVKRLGEAKFRGSDEGSEQEVQSPCVPDRPEV